MILVGNQRGGGKQLAQHLLKDENDHVEIHELRGFVSDTLMGALNEAYAVSRGTRCKQYLFSLSLNPPASAKVRTIEFEAAIERIEKRLGLSGQPRAIVFHEKQGRRHAHCVWSRIRADEMKAVQHSYSHNRLMEIARELFLEHGWKMPRGLTKSEARDPRNFSLDQWQQARRQGKDPRAIKEALQDAWAISDTKASFEHALNERGYWLARGDRRGFVALDMHGEAYALPKWIGVRTKAARERLGDEADLPSVTETQCIIAEDMGKAAERLKRELFVDLQNRNGDLRRSRHALIDRQREARRALKDRIERRKWREARERQSRFRTGLKGLWDWARGENARIARLNEAEAASAATRDRDEMEALIFAQLGERRRLVDLRDAIAREFSSARQQVHEDAKAYRQWQGQTEPEVRSRRRRRQFER